MRINKNFFEIYIYIRAVNPVAIAPVKKTYKKQK